MHRVIGAWLKAVRFLSRQAEEISPKYSKFNYVFLAKCYKDLGQKTQACQMCDAASAMSVVTKEDEEAQKELDSLVSSL